MDEEKVRALARDEIRKAFVSAKRTADQWADAIKALIAEAGADGSELWVDVEHYAGPGPYLRTVPGPTIRSSGG
jgi:hypothetical protein